MLALYSLDVLLLAWMATSVNGFDTRCLPVISTNHSIDISAIGNWSVYMPAGINSTSERETIDFCGGVCCADSSCHGFMLMSKETNDTESAEFSCALVNCGGAGLCVLTENENVTAYMKGEAGNGTQINSTISADVEVITTTGSLDLNTAGLGESSTTDVMKGNASQLPNETAGLEGNTTIDRTKGNASLLTNGTAGLEGNTTIGKTKGTTSQLTNETAGLERNTTIDMTNGNASQLTNEAAGLENTAGAATTIENRVSIPGFFPANTTADILADLVSTNAVIDTISGSSRPVSTLPTMHLEDGTNAIEDTTTIKSTTIVPKVKSTNTFAEQFMSPAATLPAKDLRTTERVDREKDRPLLLVPRQRNSPVTLVLLGVSVAMTGVVGLLLLVRCVSRCRKSRWKNKGYQRLSSISHHI